MQLPESLRERLEILFDRVSTDELQNHYKNLSDRYRRQISGSLQIQNEGEALAYLAARFPATYCAVTKACQALQDTVPGFSPRSILDIGAGPGTAALAAHDIWTAADITLIEPNAQLRALTPALFADPVVQETTSLQASPLQTAHDLVLVSYVLNELPEAELEREIHRLWNATSGMLMILEPGTPLGYGVILKLREILLRLGAHIAAPCPHAMACPLSGTERWCHFSVRVDRTSLHRRIKDDSGLNYEDEKFSYLAASRAPVPHTGARLLGHPRGSKLVSLELCQDDGSFAVRQVSKRDEIFKAARKAGWGDPL